jgi:hypothetical protein
MDRTENTAAAADGRSTVSRERINVSLTETGLAILDRERERMGLSRSAFFEVLLRFWVRDQRPKPQAGAAPETASEAEDE